MSKQHHRRFPLLLAAALLLIAGLGGFSIAKMRALALPEPLTVRPAWDVAQQDLVQDDDDESAADEVSPSQLDSYVNVYQAMQRDRTMTVDKAAAQQHMTVAQFRDIEAKIERDGVLRERVRRELLKTAQQKSDALRLKPQSAPSSSVP